MQAGSHTGNSTCKQGHTQCTLAKHIRAQGQTCSTDQSLRTPLQCRPACTFTTLHKHNHMHHCTGPCEWPQILSRTTFRAVLQLAHFAPMHKFGTAQQVDVTPLHTVAMVWDPQRTCTSTPALQRSMLSTALGTTCTASVHQAVVPPSHAIQLAVCLQPITQVAGLCSACCDTPRLAWVVCAHLCRCGTCQADGVQPNQQGHMPCGNTSCACHPPGGSAMLTLPILDGVYQSSPWCAACRPGCSFTSGCSLPQVSQAALLLCRHPALLNQVQPLS